MKLITASALAALITAAAATGNATTAVVGGDQGHEQIASETTDGCGFSPYQSTLAVGCSNGFAASGTANWQIALPVSAASSTFTTFTATATAQVPLAASNPNQSLSGRLLSWNLSGTLLCATAGASWGQSSSPVSHSLGSCVSLNPTTDRPEAEFTLGHVQGQALALMPRVYGVSYSY